MLAIETIRAKEFNSKWKKLTHVLQQKQQELEKDDNDNLSSELYKRIVLDVFHIEKLDEILKSDNIQFFPDKQQELLWEKDELRLKASFNFIIYLVTQKNIELEQKVDNFLLGNECISTTLVYSDETLRLLNEQTIKFFIENLYSAITTWKKISDEIEYESVWLVHEKSLKSIYCSLYILENTHRNLLEAQNRKNNFNEQTDWGEEDKRYENLLEDIEEWSKEEWTEEEQ
ncbi:MAG: hypothetical protein AAF383_26450, partial [Cyanobacteria bacterium P01_A01_bin.83]